MTLIELLVVVAIVMMLAAVTIPRLRPDIERSRTREAARSVQLYLSSARNQAITTGRSCGVQIERLANYSPLGVATAIESGCSATLSQVESPLGYCGETIPSTVTVSVVPPATKGTQTAVTVNLNFTPAINTNLIKTGDMIQLGLEGPLYTMTSASSGTLDVSQGLAVPWNTGAQPVAYKFFRQPVKSSAAAVQLPSPAVIDLTFSGPDALNANATPQFWYSSTTDTTPIQIMFAPDGSVDRVYVDGVATFPSTTICLLIGKRQNVNDPSPANWNAYDYSNLWVSINPRTGLIVTTDPGNPSPMTFTSMTAPNLPPQIYASRSNARQANPRGGN